MQYLVSTAAKINLSLRVTAKRQDGYHDIVSLFMRIPSAEVLLFSKAKEDSDVVRVEGMQIEGENIVSRALSIARDAGFDVPFFEVEVRKTLFPGSGLGAGSGNGAAILRCLAGGNSDSRWFDVARRTGADVPFLFSEIPLALVTSIGDVLEPCKPLRLWVRVVIPQWEVGTENAYCVLDRHSNEVYDLSECSAREEAALLLSKLRDAEQVGFLPNDFARPLLSRFKKYDELFYLFESSGSCAWGITGSGGAAFALYYEEPTIMLNWPDWVRRVLLTNTTSFSLF